MTSPFLITMLQSNTSSLSFCVRNSNLLARNFLLTRIALPSIFDDSHFHPLPFATSRTLTALIGYGYALHFLMYVDRERRPLIPSSSSWRSVVWRTSTFQVHHLQLAPFSLWSPWSFHLGRHMLHTLSLDMRGNHKDMQLKSYLSAPLLENGEAGLVDCLMLVLIVAVQRTESEHVFLDIPRLLSSVRLFPLPPSHCCIR